MLFEREILTADFMKKILWPLFVRHFKEVSANQDIPLDPAFEAYEQMEINGTLRCYLIKMPTADNTLAIVGYQIFFVNFNAHYMGSLQAVQDILFMDKYLRGQGIGKKFIEWCDSQLQRDGVQLVMQHVKVKLNFGPLLESIGYRHVENIYMRRLDKE